MPDQLLSNELKSFLYLLHRNFNRTRLELLKLRKKRDQEWLQGRRMQFLPETASVRNSEWNVTSIPPDLQDRRVEITGPAEAKMIINALNSDAKVFMADFEDALSPSWENILDGQLALLDAVRGRLQFTNESGKVYSLNSKRATLVVRPRGLHLEESHLRFDGEPISGSIFDFATYLFFNASELRTRGSGPYYYLPKLESHLEAQWWNLVINFAEDFMKIPRGTVKVTVLIETLPAAFEMEEILFELREHIVALNAGRWDYIFSLIKKYRSSADFLLPDRDQVTMTTGFMQTYCELLVQTCRKRGAQPMGGMAAFVPNRKEPEVTQAAVAKVTADKNREAQMGFVGTWVAHPDLIPTALQAFANVDVHNLSVNSFLKGRTEEQWQQALLNTEIADGIVTEVGIRKNINVAINYMRYWLDGQGAVALHNLMEDAATAEISRMQVWQWLHHKAEFLTNGSQQKFTLALFENFHREELAKLKSESPNSQSLNIAAEAFYKLVTDPQPADFLTSFLMHTLNQLHPQGEIYVPSGAHDNNRLA